MTAEARNQSIARRLIEALGDAARAVDVAEVRIGLGYTAVRPSDGAAGVAFTFRDLARGGCSVFHGLRPLAGRRAAELLPLLDSADPIEAGVGLACPNASRTATPPRSSRATSSSTSRSPPMTTWGWSGTSAPSSSRSSAARAR